MAVARRFGGSVADVDNQTDYFLSLGGILANELGLITILTIGSGEQPSIAGTSLNYPRVTGRLLPGGNDRIDTYRTMSAAPPADDEPILSYDVAPNGIFVSTHYFSGVDASGTWGSGAIVQAPTNRGSTSTMSIPMAAFVSPENATLGFFGILDDEAFLAADPSWTEIASVSNSTLGAEIHGIFKSSPDTNVETFPANSAGWAGIGIEIKAAGGGVATLRKETFGVVMM